MPSRSRFTSSQVGKAVKATAEDIRVTTVCVGVGILPDGCKGPPSGRGPGGGAPRREHERVSVDKGAAIAGAFPPPAGVGVEHGVAGRLALVAVAEILDPGNHVALAETPACAASLALKIQHTWEGNTVTTPIASVRDKVTSRCGLACILFLFQSVVLS